MAKCKTRNDMEDNELFGERHEQEENGLYGKRHAELCDLHNVSNSACPECKSTDIKTAIHTDYKECNKCYHFWEADC
jgi:hypothetical protein